MEQLFKIWSALVALGVQAAAAGIIALVVIECPTTQMRVTTGSGATRPVLRQPPRQPSPDGGQ